MMKYLCVLVFLMFVGPCSGRAIGWAPNVQNQPGVRGSRGHLAGVASSTDPTTMYRWFLRLFTQRSFINWLGRTNGINFQPIINEVPSGGGTASTVLNGQVARQQETPQLNPDLTVVRDYEPSISKTSKTTSKTTTEVTSPDPIIARDFQANDVVVLTRTKQPPKIKDVNSNVPLVPIKTGPDSDKIFDGSTKKPSVHTLPGDLIVIRDIENERHVSRNSRDQTTRSAGENVSTKSLPGGIDVDIKTATPLPVNKATSVNIKDLQVERDKISQVQTSTNRPTTENLVIIRDAVDEKDNSHIVPTRDVPNDKKISVATKVIGDGMVVMLPFGGK